MTNNNKQYLNYGNDILAGLLSGVIIIIFSISGMAYIFSGALSEFFTQGITIILLTTIVVTAILLVRGKFPLTIAAVQETSIVLLGIIALNMHNAMSEAGNTQAFFSTFITGLIISTVIFSVLFILIGQFKLANYIRFIPYPVIGGFFAGTGWFLLFGCWSIITDQSFSFKEIMANFNYENIILCLPALALAISIIGFSRIFKSGFIMPVMSLIAIVLFYLVISLFHIDLDAPEYARWTMASYGESRLEHVISLLNINHIDWQIVYGQVFNYLTIGILSTIGILLNLSAIEVDCNVDLNLNHEIKYAGVGSILAIFTGGGMLGYHAYATASLNKKLSARTRLVGITVIILSLAVLLIGTNVLTDLPKFVFAGLLLAIGLELMLQWLVTSYKNLRGFDYAIIWIIFFTILAFGFVTGIAVGIMLSLIIFVINYSRINFYKNIFHDDGVLSSVERSLPEEDILKEHGIKIFIIVLDGYLFFGNANKLLHKILDRINDSTLVKPEYIIVDFKHVRGIDKTAEESFIKIIQHAKSDDLTLVFTGMHDQLRTSIHNLVQQFDRQNHVYEIKTLDYGLEWCEDQLLSQYYHNFHIKQISSLKDQISKYLHTDQCYDKLISYFEYTDFKKGECILRQGMQSYSIYFLEKGMAELIVEDNGKEYRIKVINAGTVIGEMGFFLEIERSATIVCVEDCNCYSISEDSFKKMLQEQPEIANIFLQYINKELSEKIVFANKFIKMAMD